MRKLVWIAYLFLFVFSGCVDNDKSGAKLKTPNIIFMMSDDHAYQAISAYGGSLNKTPNIDRIANEGAIFTKGFVTNSICAPSRAVMLTGKHSFVNGKIDNKGPFNWDQDNFAKHLQKEGYQTALIGKIHLDGLPQGFDYSNVLPGQGQYYNPDFIENGIKKQYEGYCTTITTNLALDWLKNRDRKKPFMMIFNQKAPHRSWMAEKKYFELFKDRTFEPPANYFDSYEGRPAAIEHQMGIVEHMDLANDLKMLDKEGDIKSRLRKNAQRSYDRLNKKQKAGWDAYYDPLIEDFKSKNLQGKDLALWKYDRYMKEYLSTVQSVDDGVGQLLDYLKENGLEENTIVIYTSDQGFYLGEHGWFDKRWMYEESFRTPILMRYPKEIKPGTKVNKLIQNLDFAPTLLDYAGATIPDDIQGESFREIVSGKSDDWRDAIYYTYYEYPGGHSVKRHYGIRTDQYKLIHFYYDMDYWEMYDLNKDPNEMNNVYNHPDYSNIQIEMHAKLEKIRLKYGDSNEMDRKFLNTN